MKRKTYFSLLFGFTWLLFIVWIMDSRFDIRFPLMFHAFWTYIVCIEIVHAFRSKHVTGKWFHNPFDIENGLRVIKKRFAPDEK